MGKAKKNQPTTENDNDHNEEEEESIKPPTTTSAKAKQPKKSQAPSTDDNKEEKSETKKVAVAKPKAASAKKAKQAPSSSEDNDSDHKETKKSTAKPKPAAKKSDGEDSSSDESNGKEEPVPKKKLAAKPKTPTAKKAKQAPSEDKDSEKEETKKATSKPKAASTKAKGSPATTKKKTKDISVEDLSRSFTRENHDNIQTELKNYGGLAGLAEKLKTNLKSGLPTKANFEKIQEKFGANMFPEPPSKSIFLFMLDALGDKTLQILIASALISLALGIYENPASGWIEGAAILAAVLIVVMVTSINDYSKEQQFRKLSQLNSDIDVKVIRDGKQREISIKEIVVGDLVELSTGDSIPADGILTSAHSLRVDESEITGEPEPVKKKPEEDCYLTSGTQVAEGEGLMLVTAVGENTEKGNLRATMIGPSDSTPLQAKLESVADMIGYVGLVFAILTFLALLGEYLFKTIYVEGKSFELHMIGNVIHFMITAITIVVVAVPEGLPLAVTLSLAYSMTKMLKDGNLVRHLHACETMGGATNICSDKTGTLTENQMTVVKLAIGENEYSISEGELPEDLSNLSEEIVTVLTEGIAINSKAYLTKNEQGKTDFTGSKTEGALLVLAGLFEADYDEIRKTLEVAEMYPFSSETKKMSTVVKTKDGYILYTKGASEIVLDQCSAYLAEDGSSNELSDSLREKLKEEIVKGFASEGLRTLCLAYAKLDNFDNSKEPEVSLTCIGIVGIKDPLRREVADAIRDCRKAGIFVRMVTGDNILTARKIAEECGLLTEGGIALEGSEFRKLTDEQLDEKLPTLQVLARSLPKDKHRLVQRLRNNGEVVAVTGDGSNDAPALKEADVGFAMGQSGTEVAKEASDIVLLEDNFSNIVKAVMWGRNVYDSIRKFLQFQLTVNLVALVIALFSALKYGESVLSPVQLLWVNLIMDTLGALALATDIPTPDLLDRKPHGRKDALITNSMWIYIVGQAVFQVSVLFLIMFYGQEIFGTQSEIELNTIIFNTFVLCQVVNEINSRRYNFDLNVFSGILQNYLFLVIIAFTLVTQTLIVNYGGSFTKTVPLSIHQWIISGALALLGFPIGTGLRLLARTVLSPPPQPKKKNDKKSKKSPSLTKKQSQTKKTSKDNKEETSDEKPTKKATKKPTKDTKKEETSEEKPTKKVTKKQSADAKQTKKPTQETSDVGKEESDQDSPVEEKPAPKKVSQEPKKAAAKKPAPKKTPKK